ncbi:MAG: signal peptidase II [Lachnospiraceae bacterium]|nr:signal peptidase II [Lachnospiraceae bacterium]
MNNSLQDKSVHFWGLHSLIFIVALVLDQITKIFARKLNGQPAIILVENVLEFRYLENRGAAFGILQGQSVFFLLIAIIVLVFMVLYFKKVPKTGKYYPLSITFAFMSAGAVGNTIDRVYFGYVTDFIYFKLIDFPTFNVADIWITCATFILLFLILFKYKEDDFDFLKSNKVENNSIGKDK